MSAWAQLEALQLAASFAAFGQIVTYTLLGGSSLGITAILNVGGSLGVNGAFGTADVKIADLPRYPTKNDVVTMPVGLTNWPAGDYLVQDVERGSIGEVKLILRKKP